jgi:transcriptional regulator with XRE-family HTH domain
MLDWRQAQLAKQSNLSLSTLKDFEAERRTPAINNLAAIQTALENGGIRFVTQGIGTAELPSLGHPMAISARSWSTLAGRLG